MSDLSHLPHYRQTGHRYHDPKPHPDAFWAAKYGWLEEAGCRWDALTEPCPTCRNSNGFLTEVEVRDDGVKVTTEHTDKPCPHCQGQGLVPSETLVERIAEVIFRQLMGRLNDSGVTATDVARAVVGVLMEDKPSQCEHGFEQGHTWTDGSTAWCPGGAE